VLTTTKVLSSATNEMADTAANNTGWPPTPHIKGAKLESTFAQRGHGLHHYLPSAPLWLQQVHGVDVTSVDGDTNAARQTPPVADAAVTHTPNTVLAILTADCLPVVIAAEDRPALAVVHAGWRSLSGGVLENAFRSMECPAASLTAWLGPAIGPTAFEVGEDVYVAFNAALDHEAVSCFIPTGVSGKWHANLYALARLRLRRLGVSKISGGMWCTYNDAKRFFSYRRQRDEGRMATFAWIVRKAGIRAKHPESISKLL
jgi:YfiH family protein